MSTVVTEKNALNNMAMTFSPDGTKMVLTVDLSKDCGPSSTGKSNLVATSRGTVRVPWAGNGELSLSMNLFITRKAAGWASPVRDSGRVSKPAVVVEKVEESYDPAEIAEIVAAVLSRRRGQPVVSQPVEEETIPF